jgi:tRNA(Arg) A34 adenosine deaminase TadA
MGISHRCEISLPAWIQPWLQDHGGRVSGIEEGMALAIDLANESVRQGTGGPFGAVIIDMDSNELVSVGVNRVTDSGLSITHAEMVAICLAQHRLGAWNLTEEGNFALITTCEPCAMCFGAVPWSGVRALVCGARKSDAEAAGFDEGERPDNWIRSLNDRGIDVKRDVLRERAAGIFTLYVESGGEIYNPDTGGAA